MKVVHNNRAHYVSFDESAGQWIVVRTINGKLYALKLGDKTTSITQLVKLLSIDDETWLILHSS